MSRAPSRRTPLPHALGAACRVATVHSMALAHRCMALLHEAVGRAVLRTALPRASRHGRARGWFEAATSWLETSGRADREAYGRSPADRSPGAGEPDRGRPAIAGPAPAGLGARFRLRIALARCAYGVGDYFAWRRECGRARDLDAARFARLPHPFSLFDVVQPLLGRDRDQIAISLPEERSATRSRTGSGSGGEQGRGTSLSFGAPGLDSPGTGPSEAGPTGATETGPASGRTPSRPTTAEGTSGPDPAEDASWIEEVMREFDALESRLPLPDASGIGNPAPKHGADDCRDDGERRRFDALGPVEPEEILRADLDSLARRLQASDPSP